MRRLRESFAAKLLAGLLGTVGLLLLVVFVSVRLETARQEEQVASRAVSTALDQFAMFEEIQRLQTDRLAASLVDAPRAFALVEEGAFSDLAGEAVYEMERAGLLGVLLLAFTDAEGEVGLTILSDGSAVQADPVGIGSLAAELVAGTEFETSGYRGMGGRLYSVRVRVLETRAGVLLGTIAFALPVTDEDVSRIGAQVGVEACFVLDGTCLAGTAGGAGSLSPVLAGALEADDEMRMAAEGEKWSIRSVLFDEQRPELGGRVIAVPLSAVRAPFERITSTLLLAGGGSLLVAILLGLALSGGLTRPVRALVTATGAVARGEYDTEVEVTSRDEIGTLAEAFNDMTRGLRLKERYRSVLNKVVSEEVATELMSGDVELGGENREVTVLFADIRGFTALTEGMEPQEVIGLLNQAMERLSAAVETEGGIVDKYVGDELMAVFGAPLSTGEDALRAVRAAVRMRAAVEALNAERGARGEGPIGLGIGLSTGTAVAGNMGSSNRLNYTVLGDIVNLGARLCSGAAPGEILVSARTRTDAGAGIRAVSRGTRPFKGFSEEIEVFAVESVEANATEPKPAAAGSAPASIALLLALGAAAAGPAPLTAQEWPTLAGAGIAYLSDDGRVQLDLSGQLDLELLRFTGHDAGLAYGGGTWLAPRLRTFVDLFLGDAVYALVEVRADRGEAPTEGREDVRLEQAFLRVGTASGSFGVQAGRFASPFGSYAARHLTGLDPFVRPPLFYDYRTVISRHTPPGATAGFLGWKDDPATFRHDGGPPVWNVPYQLGAMATARLAGFDARVAVMNSAPSSEPAAWNELDRFEAPSLVVGIVRGLTPELTLALSYDVGPYADTDFGGMDWTAYDQEMAHAELTFARGPVMLRAEALRDRWKVPNVENDPVEWGWSGEAQVDVAPGFFLAGRIGGLDFGEVGGEPWDHDIRRYEVGAGYRLARNAGLLAGFMHNATATADPDDDLFALRLWWGF